MCHSSCLRVFAPSSHQQDLRLLVLKKQGGACSSQAFESRPAWLGVLAGVFQRQHAAAGHERCNDEGESPPTVGSCGRLKHMTNVHTGCRFPLHINRQHKSLCHQVGVDLCRDCTKKLETARKEYYSGDGTTLPVSFAVLSS